MCTPADAAENLSEVGSFVLKFDHLPVWVPSEMTSTKRRMMSVLASRSAEYLSPYGRPLQVLVNDFNLMDPEVFVFVKTRDRSALITYAVDPKTPPFGISSRTQIDPGLDTQFMRTFLLKSVSIVPTKAQPGRSPD
jgi:hypothetical protein